MTKDEALTLALNALQINRRPHYYCENRWHSCPRHEEGCANDEDGDECNCGADKANAEIDTAIAAIKALARPHVAADPKAFYGFPKGSVSTSNAGGKCVTAGETAPIDPNQWAFDRGLEST